MKLPELRAKLQHCNLSLLSRESEVHIRTLRRIKHGRTSDVLVGTIDKIIPHLKAATTEKK